MLLEYIIIVYYNILSIFSFVAVQLLEGRFMSKNVIIRMKCGGTSALYLPLEKKEKNLFAELSRAGKTSFHFQDSSAGKLSLSLQSYPR